MVWGPSGPRRWTRSLLNAFMARTHGMRVIITESYVSRIDEGNKIVRDTHLSVAAAPFWLKKDRNSGELTS